MTEEEWKEIEERFDDEFMLQKFTGVFLGEVKRFLRTEIEKREKNKLEPLDEDFDDG